MRIVSSLTAAIALMASLMAATPAKADTIYLVVGTYNQYGGGKPRIDGESSPSMTVIPMQTTEQCELAGEALQAEIFQGIKYFDARWTCVEGK